MMNDIKISICYHASKGEEEIILQSLRTLPLLKEKHKNYNFKVFIISEDELSLNDDSDDYTILTMSFRRNDYKFIEDLYKFYDTLDADYIIELNCDAVLLTLEAIEANLRRLKQTVDKNNLGMIFSENGGVTALSKNGIKTILYFLTNKLVQKRLENRKHHIEGITELLMEMCPMIMNKFDGLEGVKGHCIYGNDNLERATSVGFNGDVEAMKEYLDEYLSKKIILPLEAFIKDKSVAIVGNADVDKDYSEEIDNHDIVIRLNNFYNIDSGKVGKKVSALLLSGTSAWQNVAPKGQSLHEDIIAEQKPQIFLLSETSNQKIERLHNRYKDCPREMLGNKTSDLRYTSGTVLLKMIAKVKGYSKISLYGFDKGSNWKNYVSDNASIHEGVFSEEEQLRMQLFEELCYV